MNDTLTPDICIVGGGAAGLAVAEAAVRLGVSVVLVAKDPIGGGQMDTGIPLGTLLAVARSTRREPADWQTVRNRVKANVAALEPLATAERFTALGVQVLRDHGRFTGPKTLAAGSWIVRARRFVIATGSTVVMPKIPGIESTRVLTGSTIFDLDVLPSHLVVIGAGVEGLEFAQAFRRLGSEVTILDTVRALPGEDEELVASALAGLEREGVAIRTGVTMSSVEPLPGGAFRIAIGADEPREWIEGTHLLVAGARRPNVENLGLERANVAFADDGIRVRDNLRTTNRRIFAVGAATGAGPFSHSSDYVAQTLLRTLLFRQAVSHTAHDMPRLVRTDPELATVGMNEEDARKRHRTVNVLRAPYSANARAVIDGTTSGHLKVVATPDGRVLGAGIVGAGAGELIGPWTLAVAGRVKVADIALVAAPSPSLSEISRQAAVSLDIKRLDRPMARRAMRWLRLLG